MDRWTFLPLLQLVVPALALVVAIGLWKMLRIGAIRPPARKAAAICAFMVVLGVVYVVAFAALWAWGSGS